MRKRLVELRGKHKNALRRRAKKAKDADYRQRCLIVLRLAEGRSTVEVERQLDVARASTSRVAARFRKEGFAGLNDHRMYNGRAKILPEHLQVLELLLDCSPIDFGWSRPTWTRELLAKQLKEETGLELTPGHLGRILHRIGARWKRAKPIVLCPWPRRKRLLYLAAIKRMVLTLPEDEIAFYADEMDVHLNPKIGPDWMRKGVQKRILTPGNNKKAFVAGALDTRSGDLKWVFGERKNSDLFIFLIEELCRLYPDPKKIHVIVDNYSIHSSHDTRRTIAKLGGRIVLHFLPPYCSDENPVERVWEEVHANTTRNHKCKSIWELLHNVDNCLEALSPYPGSKASLRRVG